jgi:hypothetical protein
MACKRGGRVTSKVLRKGLRIATRQEVVLLRTKRGGEAEEAKIDQTRGGIFAINEGFNGLECDRMCRRRKFNQIVSSAILGGAAMPLGVTGAVDLPPPPLDTSTASPPICSKTSTTPDCLGSVDGFLADCSNPGTCITTQNDSPEYWIAPWEYGERKGGGREEERASGREEEERGEEKRRSEGKRRGGASGR